MQEMERVRNRRNANEIKRRRMYLHKHIQSSTVFQLIPELLLPRPLSTRTRIPLRATVVNLWLKVIRMRLNNPIPPLMCSSIILEERHRKMTRKTLLENKRRLPRTRTRTLHIMPSSSTPTRIQQPNSPHHPCSTLLPSKLFTPTLMHPKPCITLSIPLYRTHNSTPSKSIPRRSLLSRLHKPGSLMIDPIVLRLVRYIIMREVHLEDRTGLQLRRRHP